MTDISKHPILRQIYELCQAIEACGASPELTTAVTLATDLFKPAEALIDSKETQHGVSACDVTVLPDGSVCVTDSFPLPKDHWLYGPYCTEVDKAHGNLSGAPRPILTHKLRGEVVAAARYAIRGATNRGAITDFDPDALVQNVVYALCGPYGQAIAVSD